MYGGMDVEIHVFLTLALVGGEWLASCPGRFITAGKEPRTFWIGGWLGPRTGLDTVEIGKVSILLDVNRTKFSGRQSIMTMLCGYFSPVFNFTKYKLIPHQLNDVHNCL
jgi:hypothetical protein